MRKLQGKAKMFLVDLNDRNYFCFVKVVDYKIYLLPSLIFGCITIN